MLADMQANFARLLRIRVIATVLALPGLTFAAERDTSTLDTIRAHFVAARALPPGSRPPPPATDLKSLIRVPISTLEAYLGASEPAFECGDLFPRPPATCIAYTFGPEPAPEVEDPASEIAVATGGPWLLVIGISNGRVVASRWLGQR
jgi:hypothetical protein